MRDRSLSMERRPSSLDHGRGWRDLPPPAGRARADQADRWEHDKFDGTSSAPTARGGHDRSRSSATSAIQNTGPLPADLEFIGKEGVSHVTIKRRDSNASSSRAYPSSSYEPPRRQFIDTSAPPMPTTSIESSVRKPSISKAPVPAAAPAAVRPISPRSPTTTEPYRAPHRRQSSADTTTPLLPLSAATIATPLLTPQASVLERNSLHPDEPVIGKAEEEQEVANESSSSAEMEWENFVANGGLDMPIDRITDDLLKHPRSRSQSVFSPAAEPPRSVPEQQRRDPPHVFTDGSSGLDRAHDRASLLLNNDADDDDDDDDVEVGRNNANRPDSSFEKSEGEGESFERKGLAIRGSASKPRPVTTTTTTALPVPRKSSVPAQIQSSDASSLGIRIKGSSNANSPAASPAINGRTPPTRPSVTSGTGAVTPPTKPASPSANRSLSRSSSGDESRFAAQQSGSTPSSYLRRQFEVYDEGRGRHLFSINIPYDDGRYAPIHVHEKDDLPKLAAKFARTWRVHNKEQRIKLMLTKFRTLMDEPL
ncbi:hypothetical protein IWW38_000072 [Coemansia aciculifera]|uniref:Uncharacterized protein n=1 Tax=Coemansia aciculifera TaxID=417176 RepID=A0ACC1MAU8_9FUNG|nr:hypothetical protein IWW38_000072 [Coemansia aciculifera]